MTIVSSMLIIQNDKLFFIAFDNPKSDKETFFILFIGFSFYEVNIKNPTLQIFILIFFNIFTRTAIPRPTFCKNIRN